MLREALGRRGLFKRLGVGALLAASGQDNVAKLARIGVGPGAVLEAATLAPKVPRLLRSFTLASEFSSWWQEFGKKNVSSHVSHIDPDIAGFRLPLATKIRMQRERNYFIAKERAKRDYLSRILRFGKIEERDWVEQPTNAGYSNPSNSLG